MVTNISQSTAFPNQAEHHVIGVISSQSAPRPHFYPKLERDSYKRPPHIMPPLSQGDSRRNSIHVYTKATEIGAEKIRQRSGNIYSKKPQHRYGKISSAPASEFLLSFLLILIILFEYQPNFSFLAI